MNRQEAPQKPVHQLPEGVKAEAILALNHEVTDQFPADPSGTPPHMEPRTAQQLPNGVRAENIAAHHGKEPS